MSLECEHGQLRRGCYICELETENQRLRAALVRIEDEYGEEYGNASIGIIAREALGEVSND